MDKSEALEIVRKYKAAVSKVLPVTRVCLFGSYAKGNYREESDIDVAVFVSQLADNYFDDVPLLWRTTRKVSTSIEPVLFGPDEWSPLRDEVERTGIEV